jgi:Transposase DDE domain
VTSAATIGWLVRRALDKPSEASTTDPDARLFRKGVALRGDHRGRPWEPATGKEAKLCHMGHLLRENRSGLIVDAMLTPASGTAERDAAETMLGRHNGRHRASLGADKGDDAAGFVARVRVLNVTPHIARNTSRRSAIDGRTTRHRGYQVSQRAGKRIEEAIGWIKTAGGLRKTRHRGTERVGWMFTLTAAACNLIRLPKLLEAT